MSNYLKFTPGSSWPKEEVNRFFILDDQLLFKQDPEIPDNLIVTEYLGGLVTSGSLGAQIYNLDQDGKSVPVSQGGGLGTRQHNQVMLQMGLSSQANDMFVIAPNQTMYIALTVPPGRVHHAESRYMEMFRESGDDSVDFDLLLGYTEGQIPGGAEDETLTIFNQKGPVVDATATSTVKVYLDRGAISPLPTKSQIMDPKTFRIDAGLGNAASVRDAFASLQGRHYGELPDGTYPGVTIIQRFRNNGNTAVYIDAWNYLWHEYNPATKKRI